MLTFTWTSTVRAISVAALIWTAPGTRADSTFQDPLDCPAQMRKAVDTRPLLAVTPAGTALVAVGSRGMIIRSEDGGRSWVQSAAPVQSDLLAVHFPTAMDGWAVGHSGVILHSSDGGKSWAKQFDGRDAAEAFKKFYAVQGTEAAARTSAELERNYKAGPALPWLDVWFEDAARGFVVGSFGMIAATVDGGKTWEPWLERVDDDRALNLNSVRGVGANVYIAGERGMVFALDRKNQRFKATSTGYPGSFFGLVGTTDTLLAFGLRGVVYRSEDGGATWHALKLPSETTVTAGAVLRRPGAFVLVNSAGQLLLSDDDGRSFTLGKVAAPMRYTGVVLAGSQLAVVTGLNGVRAEALSLPAN
jgi:photosystem II stability/assembly factor-like uncharacterized protein